MGLERAIDIEQTKNIFASFPNRREASSVNVPLVLDAWENRDVFGYHNHLNPVSRPQAQEILKPEDWNSRTYQNWFDLYREDLTTTDFDSITEFLLTGYVLNMERFESVAGKIASVDSLIVKQIKDHVLPDKPGEFVRAYLKDELEGLIKYPDDPKTQDELAGKINVSQTWVSNLITGKFPSRVSVFVDLVRRMNLSPNLTEAVIEKYVRYPVLL